MTFINTQILMGASMEGSVCLPRAPTSFMAAKKFETPYSRTGGKYENNVIGQDSSGITCTDEKVASFRKYHIPTYLFYRETTSERVR